MAVLACGGSGAALAQSKNLGAYAGTIELSTASPELTYRALAKVSMPVSDRRATRIEAEFLAGEAPDASVLVSQWETFRREKSADSGGQFNTLKCSLAAPAEIPMSSTGVLNVDLKKKTHAMSVTLVSRQDLPFNCVHSRSGAHKRKFGIALTMGTGAPGAHFEKQLPFSEPAHLAAKYILVPPAGAGVSSPISQAWDLKLSQ
ncbi:MAG TPA: hypothetical protein VFK48_13760 [Usitatibacter sp.]|nr:hypothetical protein [Usitatibacter sp.]